MPQRIAMISDHASPLAAVGGVDSGGQNIYVAETARQLAARGYLVDIFTRKDQADPKTAIEGLARLARDVRSQGGAAAMDAGLRRLRAALRRP